MNLLELLAAGNLCSSPSCQKFFKNSIAHFLYQLFSSKQHISLLNMFVMLKLQLLYNQYVLLHRFHFFKLFCLGNRLENRDEHRQWNKRRFGMLNIKTNKLGDGDSKSKKYII